MDMVVVAVKQGFSIGLDAERFGDHGGDRLRHLLPAPLGIATGPVEIGQVSRPRRAIGIEER